MRVRETKSGKEFLIEQSEFAAILEAAGIIKIVAGDGVAQPVFLRAEKPGKRTPKTEWVVSRGSFDPIGGELRIFVSCATCKASTPIFNPTEKATFSHGLNCGGKETIPADVFEKFREHVEAAKPQKRRDGLPKGVSLYVEI